MPAALRVGLLGPLLVRGEAGRAVHVGGRGRISSRRVPAGVPPDAVDVTAFETLAARGRRALAEGDPAQAAALRGQDQNLDTERAVAAAQAPTAPPVAPGPLTSFVGRDTEVSQLLKNISSARLVTLTGPGGVGKTRLAAEVSGRLAGGAWFVPLAPVTRPAEVASAILAALGIRAGIISRRAGEPGAGPLDRLAEALADRCWYCCC